LHSPLAGELPPCIVLSHGGPTSHARTEMSLKRAFWTSRGYALIDVDYGGSDGYGRAYRMRLDGQWGVVDVDDCCNAARAVVAAGRVDGERLAISGGSAGGFTTLAALAFRDVFKAGASHYGIGDLHALAAHTHKFESRYLDSLIPPSLYDERSPIKALAGFNCPAIFFQGLDDQVVPPEQVGSASA
jgi:dipeptidyl aminopeptidase/acylaminoacyl peptidase